MKMTRWLERLGTDITYPFAYFLVAPLPLMFSLPPDSPWPDGFYPFGLHTPYILAQVSAAVPAALWHVRGRTHPIRLLFYPTAVALIAGWSGFPFLATYALWFLLATFLAWNPRAPDPRAGPSRPSGSTPPHSAPRTPRQRSGTKMPRPSV